MQELRGRAEIEEDAWAREEVEAALPTPTSQVRTDLTAG
jgi:hypothetical protein